MPKCKVYTISQWDWEGGLHRRFLWEIDENGNYTDCNSEGKLKIYKASRLIERHKSNMGATLKFTFDEVDNV